uniref:Uncharacterized protein n=1 Tax=Cacopsylla melanoneura TaxID=428564 RepID=A0A8D8ZJ18_9HEMI
MSSCPWLIIIVIVYVFMKCLRERLTLALAQSIVHCTSFSHPCTFCRIDARTVKIILRFASLLCIYYETRTFYLCVHCILPIILLIPTFFDKFHIVILALILSLDFLSFNLSVRSPYAQLLSHLAKKNLFLLFKKKYIGTIYVRLDIYLCKWV